LKDQEFHELRHVVECLGREWLNDVGMASMPIDEAAKFGEYFYGTGISRLSNNAGNAKILIDLRSTIIKRQSVKGK